MGVTKVKPGQSAPTPKKSPAALKPKVVKAPAADRAAYNAPPAPKFIIKQAGPSQTFGWVGPGRYAPLNIPNIFKAAGINTHWDPGLNSVFPVGLKYPAPPSSHPAHTHQDNVYTTTTKSTTTTTTTYRPTTVTTTPPPVTYPIPVYQPAHSTAGPPYRPPGPPVQSPPPPPSPTNLSQQRLLAGTLTR